MDDLAFDDGDANRETIIDTFDTMYFKTDALPPEWRKMINGLDEMRRTVLSNDPDNTAKTAAMPGKEQVGRMISDLQFFIQELVDYLVQRNAIYWG